jgi:hypothetical protein
MSGSMSPVSGLEQLWRRYTAGDRGLGTLLRGLHPRLFTSGRYAAHDQVDRSPTGGCAALHLRLFMFRRYAT